MYLQKQRVFWLMVLMLFVYPDALFGQYTAKGIVFDQQKKPIEKVKIFIEHGSGFVLSDAQGKFAIQSSTIVTSNNVQAVKRGYALHAVSQANPESFELTLAPVEYLLLGKVLDPQGKPLNNARVLLEPEDPIGDVRTNQQGIFQLTIPSYYRITAESVFEVNQKRVHSSRINHQDEGDILVVSLAPPVQKIWVYDEKNQTVPHWEVIVNGKKYQTNASGFFEVSPVLADIPVAYAIGYKTREVRLLPKDLTGFIYLENQQQPAAEVEAKTNESENITAESLPKPEKGGLSFYGENFNLLINQLEMEKQELIQRSNEIRFEMEKIAEKLSQENSLSAQEKRELEQYLNQLEEQLIETDLAYEDAQVKTKAIIDQMRESLHEKDSLHVAAQETIEVISTEKEEVERQKKRDLMIFTAVALMFATFSGILLVTARRIRRQRNELGVVNAQLSQTKNELEERVQEINRQNNEISRQANHLRKLNKEVSTKNQKLTDNIRYAKTVQEAILPPVNLLHGHFADFFVTYIPKDIVSGDFYWFSVVPGTQGQRVVLAAVDCTGHGVSGAFMSMMGSALLNEIVNQQQITDPATILSELNQGIVSGLRQQETANDDGMDVALCVMDRQPNGQAIALFTGAKRPVMAYHQQTGEVAIYKGDRKSVGGKHQSAEPFSVQQILLEPGDALYLFSDGLTDQNNPERKKFGSERLTQFIKTHARESMASQKQLLESALAQHQESAEQRDDIMLIGLRI